VIERHHRAVDARAAAAMAELVCTAYAKSTGVEPRGRSTTLPCGVST
jgi:hypothetical protein